MYQYEDLKPKLYSEDGFEMYAKIRDRTKQLLHDAGAFTCGAAIRGCAGDSWLMLACVDHLLAKGEIREVTDPDRVRAQDRVFVRA